MFNYLLPTRKKLKIVAFLFVLYHLIHYFLYKLFDVEIFIARFCSNYPDGGIARSVLYARDVCPEQYVETVIAQLVQYGVVPLVMIYMIVSFWLMLRNKHK